MDTNNENHIVDEIEVSNKFEFDTIQGLRGLILLISLIIAFVSINVQHEYYLYFINNAPAAFVIAIAFVLMTIILFEYSTFLRVRSKDSRFVTFMFWVCMAFIALGTFSGSYRFSQDTKLADVKTISSDNNKRETWAGYKKQEDRLNDEYQIRTNDEYKAEAVYDEYPDDKSAKWDYENKKYLVTSTSRKLDTVLSNKNAFIKANPELNLDKKASESQNKDIFEFLSFGIVSPDIVRMIMMFFGVIILDFFAPFLISLAIFRIKPVMAFKDIVFDSLGGLGGADQGFIRDTKTEIDNYTKELYGDLGIVQGDNVGAMEEMLTTQFKGGNNEKELISINKKDGPYIKDNSDIISKYTEAMFSNGLNSLKDNAYIKANTGIDEETCNTILEVLKGIRIRETNIISQNPNGTYKAAFPGAVINKIITRIAGR